MIKKMNLQDLNKLHGYLDNVGCASAMLKQVWHCVRLAQHLANAVLVFMKYKQGDEKPLEISCKVSAESSLFEHC